MARGSEASQKAGDTALSATLFATVALVPKLPRGGRRQESWGRFDDWL